MVRPAIIIVGHSALPLAQKLRPVLGADIHGPEHLAPAVDVHYGKLSHHLAALFKEGIPIVGVCASGILIRAVGPHLTDKRYEPPVLAVAVNGSSVIPLLGGHRGANDLARQIAEACGCQAAITTASDLHFGIALDEPPEGYLFNDWEDVKAFTARVVAGEPVRINGSAPWLDNLPQSLEARLQITVTDRNIEGGPDHLVYYPYCLTVGIGCERGTSREEVAKLISDTLRQNGLSEKAVSVYASIDLKEDEPAIVDEYFPLVQLFTAEELAEQRSRLKNPSALVEEETGTPGVAEAAALAAAGPEAELIVPKTKSKHATCAVARAPSPILEDRGRAPGRLCVVGVGPGTPFLRTQDTSNVLAVATDWVGYDLYLDLIRDLKHQQTLHPFPLGAEEERVRHAINLAKQGKCVALICSGDAGIYAMASLVYEIIDKEPCRIAVNVIPGISAFQAAAAKAGAMIGHDFCCISLSDLLTPWEVIERRIRAAAEGDFVVSFYNPRSLKRRDQLERAFAILKPLRKPDTPVVIATKLGRPEEKVKIVNFSELNPEEVDMLTLVMVGASQSKSFKRGDGRTYAYTPRGYAKKREAAE